MLRRPGRTIVTGDARAVLRARDRHPDRVPAARGGDAVDPLEHVERAVEGSRVRASASAHHSPAGPHDRFADGGTPRRPLLMRAFGTNAERLEKPGFHPQTISRSASRALSQGTSMRAWIAGVCVHAWSGEKPWIGDMAICVARAPSARNTLRRESQEQGHTQR